jgi:hypothetical protein
MSLAKHVGGLVGCVMTPHVVGVPLQDPHVVALGEAADRLEVARELRQADRHRRRPGRVLGLRVLVVEADRGAGRAAQPVDRHVRQAEIVGDVLQELAHPSEQPRRRVGDRVGDRLRRL